MADAEQIMASAGAVLDRLSEGKRLGSLLGLRGPAMRADARRARARRRRKLKVASASLLAVWVVMFAWGLMVPIGLFGALFFFFLMIAVPVAILALWPGDPPPPAPEQLRTADLKALPAQTERWLSAQRPALPAPAAQLTDRIGTRLRALEPQLAGLAPGAPAGEDLRQLVAEQLPEFVRGYQRVPSDLRRVERNGRTPDAQLVEGLQLIDRQLADVSAQLAEGDLDALSTRGRYLEIKYRGDGAEG